jgi:hypothetical protein
MDVWKHSVSVDKPYKKREGVKMLRFHPQDIENEFYAEYLASNGLALDEQVIAKIDSERFLHSLDYNEREIVKYKLKGLADGDIVLELGITRKHYRKVKRDLKPKIVEYFTA